MTINRLKALLQPTRQEADRLHCSADLRGFTANPFAHAVTPAQAILYLVAFQKAQQEVKRIQQPWPDCSN